MIYFFKGLIIGFSIAAPIGPIGVLCIQRTLNKGKKSGFFTGLGAATADATYGFIAAFGLTFISNFLIKNQFLMGLFGGLFLLYLGIKTFISKPLEKSVQLYEGKYILDDYLSTLILTITNPMTIISFIAIFAGFGFNNNKTNYISSLCMVLGVFLGSATWWLFLSNGISIIKDKINNLKYINMVSGAIIIVFGVLALLKLI